MFSDSCNPAVIQHNNLVRMQNRTDALCHNHDRRVGKFLMQRLPEHRIRFIIQCGKTIIKKKYFRPSCNGSGNGKPLCIDAIEPGYAASTSLSGPILLTPVWRVTTDTGAYQLDNVTGGVTRVF